MFLEKNQDSRGVYFRLYLNSEKSNNTFGYNRSLTDFIYFSEDELKELIDLYQKIKE